MGIHLYKKMGWGLTGLEYDQQTGALTDNRISIRSSSLTMPPDRIGPEYLAYLEALRAAEPESSGEWFELSMTIEMVKADSKKEGELPWPVTRETESGRRDLLLIQPPGFSHWTRYADQIDQAEENILHADEWGRVVEMPYGIYPFEGLYMDSRDGRRLDSTAKRLIDKLLVRQETEEDQKFRGAADHLAKMLGFTDAGHAQEHIAPVVPPDIRYVASWLNLFNGPDVWLQLRPMLYVYWA